jgi:threonine/homoserine/homoserine lactone efflux protein
VPDLSVLLVFVVAAGAISLAPGPDMIYVMANAVGRGAGAGLLSAVGISVAMLVHTAAAALGLSYLFAQSAWAFEAVRYAGAAYLILLGIGSLRGPAPDAGESRQDEPSPFRILRQGFLTNLLNPKVILFFAAFLPQFVVPQNGSATLQFLFFGAVFTSVGLLSDSAVAVASGKVRGLISERPGALRLLHRASGAVFVGLGVRLLLARPSA